MRHVRNERGFSLAELLVATAIIGVVMAGVFVVQRGGQHVYLWGSNRVETQQNARMVLDLMTRELRGATAITTLGSATDVTFVWEDEAKVAHTIRYALSGTTLARTLDGTATPLIGGVASLSMSYYKVYDVFSGTYTTAQYTTGMVNEAPLVRVVKISLATRTEDGASDGSPGDARSLMESTVTLRSKLE